MPGFERGKNLKKMGMKAQDTSELFFDNLHLPKEALLGKVNHGFYYLMVCVCGIRVCVRVYACLWARSCACLFYVLVQRCRQFV